MLCMGHAKQNERLDRRIRIQNDVNRGANRKCNEEFDRAHKSDQQNSER